MAMKNTSKIICEINNLESLSVSCRICMSRSDNKCCIFDAGKRDVVKEIQFCTGVQFIEADELPSTICAACLNTLTIAHKFKTLCLLANDIFNSLILSSIKKDKLDLDSDVEYEDIEYIDSEYESDVKEETVEREIEGDGVRKSSRLKFKKKALLNQIIVTNKLKNVASKKRKTVKDIKTLNKHKNNVKSKTQKAKVCKVNVQKENYSKVEDIQPPIDKIIDNIELTTNTGIDKENSRTLIGVPEKQVKDTDSRITELNDEAVESYNAVIDEESSRLNLETDVSWAKWETDRDSDSIELEKDGKCTKKTNSSVPRKPYRPRRRYKKFKFRQLWCEPCGIKFDSREQSDHHKREMHKDSQGWVCEVCGKVFLHQTGHSAHAQTHLPPRFACEHCEYKTAHKNSLVKHMRVHTGVRPYQCEYCPKTFTTSAGVRSHIQGVHLRLKPHACPHPHCGKTYFSKTKRDIHTDMHESIKRFECEQCGSCFTRRCTWRKHLLDRHGVDTPRLRPGPARLPPPAPLA